MRKPPVLFSAAEIAERVDTLAREIAAVGIIGPDPLMLMVVLRGGFVFAADLARALSAAGLDAEINFIKASSYGEGRQSSGTVELTMEGSSDITGRDVLIIDDILETGHTLHALSDRLARDGARRVRTCVLLDKQVRRKAAIEADFVGFEAPDVFVVGYGMDVAGKGRGLAYIGTAPDAS